MKAAEARELAIANQVKDQYDTIFDIIKKEVQQGKLECWIYNEVINDPTRELLTEDGYNVGKLEFDRMTPLTKITW